MKNTIKKTVVVTLTVLLILFLIKVGYQYYDVKYGATHLINESNTKMDSLQTNVELRTKQRQEITEYFFKKYDDQIGKENFDVNALIEDSLIKAGLMEKKQ